ncbi:MAG: sigma-70 family RNA polymerase sigma factor [Phycisphaerales bacterium]|nr:sigma-70 family RNA polymerase sigma factor [Phycisphaerales bacterium]
MTEAGALDRRDWLEAAFARYEAPLLSYAARLTGNLETARDVVQEAFMKLLAQDRANLNGNEAAWLYTVCRNRALDLQRRSARAAAALQERADAPAARSPDASAQSREDSQHVLGLVARLPQDQQEAVILRFQCDLSYKQIAEVTGQSTGTVGYLLHMALRALREQMLKAESRKLKVEN